MSYVREFKKDISSAFYCKQIFQDKKLKDEIKNI